MVIVPAQQQFGAAQHHPRRSRHRAAAPFHAASKATDSEGRSAVDQFTDSMMTRQRSPSSPARDAPRPGRAPYRLSGRRTVDQPAHPQDADAAQCPPLPAWAKPAAISYVLRQRRLRRLGPGPVGWYCRGRSGNPRRALASRWSAEVSIRRADCRPGRCAPGRPRSRQASGCPPFQECASRPQALRAFGADRAVAERGALGKRRGDDAVLRGRTDGHADS